MWGNSTVSPNLQWRNHIKIEKTSRFNIIVGERFVSKTENVDGNFSFLEEGSKWKSSQNILEKIIWFDVNFGFLSMFRAITS